ncbi:MAG: hypothetical protein CVU53_01790 [Deltaproteobacteria bacterium HGW-Deltaproteobacteria-11]|nr:MAG: hypothetical protein CVU53_01790 [Deltaproteobacteria bacterium HGW-Deltaproteobacteria-11]
MTNYPHRSTPLSILNDAMTEEFRSIVIRRALDCLEQASAQARRQLRAELRRHVRLPGFADSTRALNSPKRPALISELITASHRSDALMGTILRVWDQSHPELHQAVLAFLRDSADPVREPVPVETEFPRIWPQSHMLAAVASVRQQHPSFDEDDTALMLCYISGRAPIPDELMDNFAASATSNDQPQGGSQDKTQVHTAQSLENTASQETVPVPTTSSLFQNILTQLQSLPHDAIEWEQMPAYAASLQALAEQKLAEREQGRDQLRQALILLSREAGAPLAWWGYDVSTWSADLCPWNQAAALAQQIQQWQTALLEHAGLLQAPTGSRTEEQARRSALDGLEADIQGRYAKLNAALRRGSPGPVTPSDAGTTAPQTPSEPTPELQQVPEEMAPVADSAVSHRAGLTVLPAQETTLLEPMPSPTIVAETLPAEAAASEIASTEIVAFPEDTAGVDMAEFVPEIIGEEEAACVEAAPRFTGDMLPSKTEPDSEPPEQEEVAAAAGAMTPFPELQPTPATEAPAALSPVQEAPTLAQLTAGEDDSDEAWYTLLWTMVAENDLSGGYWLAKSLSARERPTLVPDWLLAAVQGSRWITADTPGLARDLLQIAPTHTLVEDTLTWELLAIAAALRPALVAPASGMINWLNPPTACPALREFVLTIRNFAAYGVGLHREDALGIAGKEQRDEAIAAASREASRWLQEAPIRRKRVSSVWRSLVGSRGALRDFLLPVCENHQEKLDVVRAELASWQDRPTVYARFDEMNVAGSPGRPGRVTGAGKQDLYREVERAVELAERWHNLVERARSIEARGDWFRDQVTALRDGVEKALPEIDNTLEELIHGEQPVGIISSAQVLQASLRQVRELLDLPISGGRPAAADFSLWALASTTDSLDALLAARLLWLPEVTLNDYGLPTPEGLRMAAPALRTARQESRTLYSAANLWLAQQDYRFFDRLVATVADEALAGDLQQRYGDALGASRAALRASIAETSNLIEQALLDGVISDEQRASYGASFASLSIEEVRNFRAKLTELEQTRQKIREGYEKRLAYLQEQYEVITDRLKTSLIPAERQREAMTFVAAAMARKDVRVAEESLASLRQVLDEGKGLPDDWYAPASSRDCLEEFNSASQRIEVWQEQTRGDLRALAAVARDGTTTAGIPFGRLGEPRRKEAAEALLSWRTLKQQSAKSNNAAPIAAILRYLGFDLKTGDAASIDIANSGADWLHAHAFMSAGDLARPIPEFGSQAQGRYDIICLWERPGADTIAARVRDLNLDIHTVIVLYLGRLTVRQKRDIIRVSRDKELAIAVLDETLLIFLAQERDVRLPAFLRCALPFSALNPYRPFQAGDVSPEMFFGREAMANELQRQGGSCLVYGGRQLGKSALLRHVERQFHHPEQEQYAWVENMALVFDPSAGKGSKNIWRNLREGFKAQKLLDSRTSTERPEEIARYIREAMQAKPRQRVLVMLDEADGFLDADARDGFRTVIALRELMLSTAQRFKVIFAGLQNVQRFQGIPNQPLAHFGTPLCVGPLEPGEAQQLVRHPLEVLGYRFADDGAVLRILSYTNYHPGLIQYFCQELLKQLRDRASAVLPPYQIQQENIEAIYRQQQVRDRIRERFEWTLGLDTHYQAIAWALIEDQIRDRDGYGRAYPPSDILQLAREWWPAGFQETSSDQLRGWLDELCGLGVLVRNASGHYRLRSPNMVRLLGKETDIGDRLLELMEKSPIPAMEADGHHAPLNDKATSYSPLTYAEERSLSQPRFGVGLVFASEALGYSLLPAAIRRFLPMALPPGIGDCTSIPSSVTVRDLDDWLKGYLKSHPKTERMLLYQQVRQAAPRAMAELVDEAHRFCQRHQAKDRWLRILFLFDPQSTWQWVGLSESERLELEEAADAALWPRPWTLSAIRRRLAQHDKLDTDDVGSKEALRVTEGWPDLLNDLFQRSGKETDLRPAAQEIEQELTTRDSKLTQHFRSRLGTIRNEATQRVLKFVLEEGDGQLPEELLTPEIVGGKPELIALQCNQAKEFLLRLGLLHLQSETLVADPLIARLMAEK